MQCQLSWTSVFFSVQRFIRIITTANVLAKNRPSMYQAIFGEPHVSLHMHNWFTHDDTWHRNISTEVLRWIDWAVDTGTMTQLILFASIFNGDEVVDMLRECTDMTTLPVRAQDPYIRQCETVEQPILKLIGAKKNPFSLRFRGRLHNACIDVFSFGREVDLPSLERCVFISRDMLCIA